MASAFISTKTEMFGSCTNQYVKSFKNNQLHLPSKNFFIAITTILYIIIINLFEINKKLHSKNFNIREHVVHPKKGLNIKIFVSKKRLGEPLLFFSAGTQEAEQSTDSHSCASQHCVQGLNSLCYKYPGYKVNNLSATFL